MSLKIPRLYLLRISHPQRGFVSLIRNSLGDQICQAPLSDTLAWVRWGEQFMDDAIIEHLDSGSFMSSLAKPVTWLASSFGPMSGPLIRFLDLILANDIEYRVKARNTIALIADTRHAMVSIGAAPLNDLKLSSDSDIKGRLKKAEEKLKEFDDKLKVLTDRVRGPNPQLLAFIGLLRCIYALSRCSITLKLHGKLNNAAFNELWYAAMYLEYEQELRLVTRSKLNSRLFNNERGLPVYLRPISPPENLRYIGIIKLRRLSKRKQRELIDKQYSEDNPQTDEQKARSKGRAFENFTKEKAEGFGLNSKPTAVYVELIDRLRRRQKGKQPSSDHLFALIERLPPIPDAKECEWYWERDSARTFKLSTRSYNAEKENITAVQEASRIDRLDDYPFERDWRTGIACKLVGFVCALYLAFFVAIFSLIYFNKTGNEAFLGIPLNLINDWWSIPIATLIFARPCIGLARWLLGRLPMTVSVALLLALLTGLPTIHQEYWHEIDHNDKYNNSNYGN
ncbi:hypothetical protein [Marinobacter lipolyticus]|uniref:hypothetical protein n=1 Tax=Marinobacter lipolyticus TaxID=209639 RepID=UPI003A957D01